MRQTFQKLLNGFRYCLDSLVKRKDPYDFFYTLFAL